MGENDSQKLLEMVGNTERGEGNRKLRMSQSPSVLVICLGVCEKSKYFVQLCHHHCVCFFWSMGTEIIIIKKNIFSQQNAQPAIVAVYSTVASFDDTIVPSIQNMLTCAGVTEI